MTNHSTTPGPGENRRSRPGTADDSTGPSRWTLASFGVLALLVLCGVVVAVSAATDDTTTPVAPEGAVSSSSCGLVDGAGEALDAAPAARWTVSVDSRMASPSSAEHGPARTAESGVHSCFARSEAGALFAAAHFMLDAQNPSIPDADLAERIVDDEHKAAFVADFVTRPQSASGGELAGYRIGDYTPSSATIELVWRVAVGPRAGALGTSKVTVSWIAGDWLAQGTATEEPTRILSSMHGYTEWGMA